MSYTLRLTVGDGDLTSSDDVRIIVNDTPPETIRVPQDYLTIQAAIDSAQVGSLILVSPGIYVENLQLSKSIILASTFYTTGDESLIDQTVISSPDTSTETLVVESGAGAETKIIGFTIRDGSDGIKVWGKANVLNNHLLNAESVGLELSADAAAFVQGNVIENNGDAGIEINQATALIQDNLLQTNVGDGIEIRAKNGPALVMILRDNIIAENYQDGIQFIDDDVIGATSTKITIDRNLITDNGQAGLGLMDNSVSNEDFRAASLLERIHLFNNTFAGNQYGVTGGDNLIAINNIFVDHANVAVKQIDGNSVVSYNLFWNNGTDNQGSNLDNDTSLFADPLLDDIYHLQTDSPAIDAGTSQFALASSETVLNYPLYTYGGTAPDLGAFETNFTPGNLCPTVDAGPDQYIAFSQTATLNGTVTDDGMINPIIVTWSKVSGPGIVTFTNPNVEDTVANFSAEGTYILRLTADDGELIASDEVMINYGTSTFEVAVASPSDDAEESDSGSLSLLSSDLELVYDGSNQTVGMRFNGITIPRGASIIEATVQFQVDEVSLKETYLTIQGEDSDNPVTFSSANNITSRPRTTASLSWSPRLWPTVGEAGADQRTPNIAAIIQEILDRPSWHSGNSLVLIISGTGERTAESYDGDVNGAPLLHVKYSEVPINKAPVVTISAPADGSSFDEGAIITFSGSAFDAEDGDLTAGLSWNSSLDGTIGTGGSFTAALSIGVHAITAAAIDIGGQNGTDQISLTVSPSNDPPVARDDTADTAEDTLLTINVFVNDSDADGNLDPGSTNTACTTCFETASGTLVNNFNGTFDYIPGQDFNGSDGFVYEICDTFEACDTATVTINVDAVDDMPVAFDDNATTIAGTPVIIDVAANDSDPDGDLDPTTANTNCEGCYEPTNGILTNYGDGTLAYSPNPGFAGGDGFVYEICDASGLCDMATVTIAVTGNTIQTQIVQSTDDAEEVVGGKVRLTSGDLELVTDNTDIQIVGLRFNGINIPQGAVVTTAYVQFKVDETDSEPTRLIIEGEDADNPVTFDNTNHKIASRLRTTSNVIWQPAPWLTKSAVGPDQRTPDIGVVIQEIVNRSGWSSGNSLVLIISGSGKRVAASVDSDAAGAPLLYVEFGTGSPNDPPVAADDSASTQEDIPVILNVVANDVDPNGNLEPSTINTGCGDCSQPANGSLTKDDAGSFTYLPYLDFNGNDSFVYEVCDTRGACDTALVNVTILPVEDPPRAYDDTITGIAGFPVLVDVAANDIDPDGNLQPSSANTVCFDCTDPANGVLANNGDGSFTYTPDDGSGAADEFVYEICDTLGLCDTAVVYITFGSLMFEVRIASSTDDVEERPDGKVSQTSSDLELVTDNSTIQVVGLRFNGVSVPQGSTITKAYLQFKVDETSSDQTSLAIQGESVDDAAPFTSARYGISSRTWTSTLVPWNPVAWLTKNESGPDQQSTDIAAIIQEIIDRPGWMSDNSLVIIITGTGKRVAESYDGDIPGAPLLHIEYQ